MSRTSSEPVRERSRTGRRRSGSERPDAAFRASFIGTVTVLAVLCGVFLTLGYLQGPKLSDARVDAGLAVAQSGQQLRFFADQPVAEVVPEQVTITPAARYSVLTAGDLVAVQFDERLRYGTTYTVEVSGVTSESTGMTSTLRYEFTTASPPLHFLDRAPVSGEGDDAIVRTSIATNDREVLYSAPAIQDYAVLENSLVVATALPDGTSALTLVSLADGTTESIRMPQPARIESLQAAASVPLIGFTVTSEGEEGEREFDDTLFTIDLATSRSVEPVTALGGSPMTVLAWQFMPDGALLVAQQRDQSVSLIDPASPGTATPLGTFSDLGRVSVDGSSMAVTDPFGPVVVSLADLSERRLEQSPLAGEQPIGGELQMLADGSRVQQAVIFDATSGRYSSLLIADNGAEARILFRTVNDAGSIEGFSVSPNGQYVAVEVVPSAIDSESDGNPVDPRPSSLTTVFVDIASGEIVKTVEGFATRW